MSGSFTIRRYRPADDDAENQPRRCGRATFAVRHRSTLAHVTVTGEIDAVNGREFASYAERHIGLATQLILDLRNVEFFGSQGFTALCHINAYCRNNDITWRIATSRSVRRILSICDPAGELPLAISPRSSSAEVHGDFAGART